jgi:hypothetical protein
VKKTGLNSRSNLIKISGDQSASAHALNKFGAEQLIRLLLERVP